MGGKLTLNNGTELTGRALETGAMLFIYVYGKTMGDLFPLVNDPEAVNVIRWEQYGEEGTVTGYRKLKSISDEGNGMISVSLAK